MLPKYHLSLTIILAAILLVFDSVNISQALLIIFGGFFIDTDKWLLYVIYKKDFSIRRSFKYFNQFSNMKKRPVFLCIFHTVESFILMIILSFIWLPFFYILIGMTFHLFLDLIYAYKKGFYAKKVFLIQSLIEQWKNQSQKKIMKKF